MFAVLFVVAWFASGGNTPDYAATDQDWTTWADDNQWKSRIGGFLILLAGFVFLHFAGTIRSVLGSAEATVRGSVQLARVAYAGAITGITGITMAIVMIAAAATEGADADPVVSRAVTSAAAGPYFIAAMGFAVMLAAAGMLTLRTGVFARWIGIVALIGALGFVITFFALIQGTSEDSVFGYGFLPGILALAIWSSRDEHRYIRRGGNAIGRISSFRLVRRRQPPCRRITTITTPSAGTPTVTDGSLVR